MRYTASLHVLDDVRHRAPPGVARRCVLASPSPAHNLSSLLAGSAKRFAASPAVAIGSAVLHTYGELASRAARLAFALRAAGLGPGDRVLLAAGNCAP